MEEALTACGFPCKQVVTHHDEPLCHEKQKHGDQNRLLRSSAWYESLVQSHKTDMLDRLKLCIRQSCRVFPKAEISGVKKRRICYDSQNLIIEKSI